MQTYRDKIKAISQINLLTLKFKYNINASCLQQNNFWLG
jgi:hypothetical protein